ncbi:hypothetical protein KA025_02975 [Candidatus Saccharibacteria bacterium]|nr:hypothetical protein [Candidatus Saccharibacteria bacterium]
MEKELIEKEIEGKTYKFAKTMANIPHSYTLEHNWEDKDLFKKAVEHINANGYSKFFYGKEYKYLNIGKYKYWAMKISDGSGIINRTEIENN